MITVVAVCAQFMHNSQWVCLVQWRPPNNLGVLASSIFTQLFYLFIFRAQNNFWTMARHNDWPKKFLLGKISFSNQSKKGGEREIILAHFSICDHDCIFRESKIYVHLQVRIWLAVQEQESGRPVNMTGKYSFWPVKMLFWPDIVC